MTTPELSDFVKTALARGIPRVQVESALQGAGWTHDQIRAALAGFAEVDFPIPVPRARSEPNSLRRSSGNPSTTSTAGTTEKPNVMAKTALSGCVADIASVPDT